MKRDVKMVNEELKKDVTVLKEELYDIKTEIRQCLEILNDSRLE